MCLTMVHAVSFQPAQGLGIANARGLMAAAAAVIGKPCITVVP